jgi:very-short-patch-repair endonuclease
VDFYCPELKLIVEVDGGIHESQHEQDTERQALLEACGYKVLRFPSSSVETNLSAVLASLRSQIELLQRQPLSTNPPLSP